MNETWLGTRLALDWEKPAIERARQCERDRVLDLLAGLITEYPRPPEPKPGRRTIDLALLP